ncbi:MAG: sodium:proton antiporter [Microbacteriaceae bacterium]|jgi:Kef-type K+ transport system membrane component KefB|nr:sodium:proton antiporter [Microbacteriaceae bacterium]
MSFATLALVVAVGLLGPLLAGRATWNISVVIGELAGGLLIGASGFHLVDSSEPTFALLASIGFGLTMFVVGSRVPVRDPLVRGVLGRSVIGAVVVGVIAAGCAIALAAIFHTGHVALYGVIIASSSAALVLPVVSSLGMKGPAILRLTVQVAIADAACIIALPLAIDPAHAGRAALGVGVIAACAIVLYLVLRFLDRRGHRRRLHDFSQRRRFALELRINTLLLFSLAAIAEFTHVSILLAGFALGLVVGAIGEPRRLTRQLFGITEGFFGPLFFVWLGASINLADLGRHPSMILLGVALGAAGIVAHLAARATGLPWLLSVMSAGQLGVPIAAAALGLQLKLLAPGEGAALLLGALITVAATSISGSVYSRRTAATYSPGSPGSHPRATDPASDESPPSRG